MGKQAQLLTLFSLMTCFLHAILLQTPWNDYLYTSLFKVMVFLLCPILYFKVSKEGTFRELLSLFSVADKKTLKLPIFLGLGVFAFIVAAFVIIAPLIDREMVEYALAEVGITPRNAVFVVLYIVVINAALEQLFFRGFVFMTLHRMNFKRYAHGYSALLFAVYHIPVLYNALTPGMLLLSTVGLVAAGLVFNVLTLKCQSISGSLIVHISANLALNLMIGIYFVFAQ